MRSTGLFSFIEVQGAKDLQPDQVFQLASLTASCQTCQHTFSLTAGSSLVLIAGGAVVTCPACKARQAISNARFEEFSRRTQAGRKPA